MQTLGWLRHRARVAELSDRQRAVARALESFAARHQPTGDLLPVRRRRPGTTPEGKLLRAILERLRTMPGVLCLRNSVGVARLGDRTVTYGLGVGSSDLLVLVAPSGRAVFLEVKAPDGRLTEAQTAFLGRVRALGCGAAVVRSVADAVAAVEAAERGTTRA